MIQRIDGKLRAVQDPTSEAPLDILKEAVLVDIDCSVSHKAMSIECMNSLTAARGGTMDKAGFLGPYLLRRGTRLHIEELMASQGLSNEDFDWRRCGLGKRALGRALGNAISNHFYWRLLGNALFYAGLTDHNLGNGGVGP